MAEENTHRWWCSFNFLALEKMHFFDRLILNGNEIVEWTTHKKKTVSIFGWLFKTEIVARFNYIGENARGREKRMQINCQCTEIAPKWNQGCTKRCRRPDVISHHFAFVRFACFSHLFFISFAFKWNRKKKKASAGKDQIESASGKFDSPNDFQCKLKMRVTQSVYTNEASPIHCCWMCSTNCAVRRRQ